MTNANKEAVFRCDPEEGMFLAPDGDYVTYDDYEALAARLDAAEREAQGWSNNAWEAKRWETGQRVRAQAAEAKLAVARDALRQSEAEIDDYIRQEYPRATASHERYRQRDFSANPARQALARIDADAPARPFDFTSSFKRTLADYERLPAGSKADYERSQGQPERPEVTVGAAAREQVAEAIFDASTFYGFWYSQPQANKEVCYDMADAAIRALAQGDKTDG